MKALFIVALLVPHAAFAVEYDCTVKRKIDSERVYTVEELTRFQFTVRIRDEGSAATISRCSFAPSQQKVTCDTYQADKIAIDEVQRFEGDTPVPGESVKIKKYYRFVGQFDVQLFPWLAFVENNGRGGIAYGKCRIVSP